VFSVISLVEQPRNTTKWTLVRSGVRAYPFLGGLSFVNLFTFEEPCAELMPVCCSCSCAASCSKQAASHLVRYSQQLTRMVFAVTSLKANVSARGPAQVSNCLVFWLMSLLFLHEKLSSGFAGSSFARIISRFHLLSFEMACDGVSLFASTWFLRYVVWQCIDISRQRFCSIFVACLTSLGSAQNEQVPHL